MSNRKSPLINRQKGFTLVEILVTMSIFVTIVAIAANYFTFAILAQRQVISVRPMVDEMSFIAGYVSRALRPAQKSTDDICGVPPGAYYAVPPDGQSVKFIDRDGRCREIRRVVVNSGLPDEYGALEERIGADPFARVTSSGVNVSQVRFAVLESESETIRHPRITISLSARPAGVVLSPQLDLQTTISQRDFAEEI